MKIILFIDGRNFINKISSIVDPKEEKDIDFSIYNFKGLFDKVLTKININNLQPAIKELEKKKIERIYLGFEDNPNKGLAFTTNRTILIRN